MIIAVDTGGTKTLVTSFKDNEKAPKSHRFTTPKSAEEYLEILVQLLTTEYDLKKTTCVCIAMPGMIDKTTVNGGPNINWKKFDLVNSLSKALSLKIPVLLQNDSNLAGLAEAHALKSRYNSVLYVTVSTGIGISYIKNDVFHPEFSISEGGHMILEYDGVLREWEQFASGRAIYETYGRYAHDITDERTWGAIADKVSRGLLVLLPIFQPQCVVIGGSIGTYFDRYKNILSSVLNERLPKYILRPILCQAQHPEEAVLYGCNIYANQKLT